MKWPTMLEEAGMRHKVTIHATPDPATTKMEMQAVVNMGLAREGSNNAIRWEYTRNFDPSSIPAGHKLQSVDFHQRFPAIAKLELHDKPQMELLAKLRSVPAGIALYTGGPGSGKSTIAGRIALAAVQSSRHNKVLWVIHSNELCDDAVQTLKHGCSAHKNVRVGRLPTMRVMEDTLLKACSKTNEPPTRFADRRSVTEQKAAYNPDSITAIAIQMAKDHSAEHSAFWNPDVEYLNWKAACRDLLGGALGRFDILVGTPFAVGQLGGCDLPSLIDSPRPICKDWKPTLIIVEEAGRIPEVQWWIPVSAFPDALVLSMGDTRQFKPLSLSVQADKDREHSRNLTHAWKCTFGEQRQVSILERAELCGQLLAHLSTNRRNRGQIAEWAASSPYRGEMKIEYLRGCGSGLEIEYTDFFSKVLRTRDKSNSVVCDAQGVSYCEGTGLVNHDNRKFAFDLISKAYSANLPSVKFKGKRAQIMIITPYTAQLLKYRTELRRATDPSITNSDITARTIDSSMSAEADLVIFDSVRGQDISGFLDNEARMTVATTRARGGAVMIVRGMAITSPRRFPEGDGSFWSFVALHKNRHRYVRA
ncbi:DNA polymerase alpha-associated DNA helicase A [Colletotrichum spinosum]|uniref:DNA polymerase alpha-associated DNA helicase A n=1 Tax=Colletotrichum spinosum TaxID=1347390 RepID=A0A4R8QB84_9PEZI|nr:DNA polymerase alpha-associated DNA helicase A [Colletotrichum spinosum]